VEHEDFFQNFFKEGTVSCGGLQASILHDFLSPVAKVEVQILGLIGKILLMDNTSWTAMHSVPNSFLIRTLGSASLSADLLELAIVSSGWR
jgi:hypothetical protein